MPRQRMVKPEFFDSESVCACSFAARIAFIGLWVMGDDFGNQKAETHRLRRRIFPCDDMSNDEFMSLLCELEEVGCIKGYEVNGELYINVPNFGIYQTVNRPSKSSNPKPPKATVKAARTKLIKKWASNHAQLTHNSMNTHGISEHSHTTHPERKKEGKKEVVVLQQQLPDKGAEHGADAGKPAPRSARTCGQCGKEMEPTNSFTPGKAKRYWRCDQCGEMEAFDA